MTLAISLFVHGEAVRFNRGKSRGDDYDFKYLRGTDGNIYPYVSSQCFKRYWRESLPTQPSPITRAKTKEGKEKNQVYTDGDPITYVDDDLFGYMIAGAEEESEESTEASGKEEIETPEQIERGDVDESLFSIGDVNDPNKLLERLRDKNDQLSQHLISFFSDEHKKELDAHLTTNEMPEKLEKILVEELNKILNSELYGQTGFKDKIAKSDLKKVGENPIGKARTFLNRKLLEKIFKKEIVRKEKKRDTTKRTAPIRMHALVAFSGVKLTKDFQTFSRDIPATGKDSVLNPNPVGIYSGWLKTRMLIEEHRIGKFYIGKNMDILDDQLDDSKKTKEESNPYSRTGDKIQFFELSPEEKKERFSLAVKALADVGNKQGPASGALHDGSLRPKAFIAAFMKCADSPFDYIWVQQNGIPKIDVQRLQKAINDWKGLFEKDKIYIGMPIEAGEEEIDTIKKSIEDLSFDDEKKFSAEITTPRQALLKLAEDINPKQPK